MSVGFQPSLEYDQASDRMVVRRPRSPANPAYPNGLDLDMAYGATPACVVELPQYPGQLGHYELRCLTCGFATRVAGTGRPDGGKLMRVACRGAPEGIL